MTLDDLKFLLRETVDPGDAVCFVALAITIGTLVFRLYLHWNGTPIQ